MVANRKPSGRAMSLPGGIGVGALGALLWTLGGAALLAKLIDMETLQENAVGYGSLAILLSASWLGALLGYHKVKRQRMLTCLATGGAYFAALLAITALFFGGQYSAVGVTAAVVLAGSGAAALMGMRQHRKTGAGTRKIRR